MADHLANLARTATAAGDTIGCVFARADIVSKGSRRPYRIAEDLLPEGAALTMGDIIKAWLATERCPLWTSAVAMKREILIGAGLFPAGRARRGGDKDMWLRAVAACASAYSPAISAEFHQDTENRVTRSTAHVDPPVLIETIAALIETAAPHDRALLRALANQELALYARHAAGRRSAVGARFLRAVYLPEGVPAMTRIMSYMLAVPVMRAIDAIRR
jgi:succinoglycan biosynthesis protein ExoO